MAPCSLDGTEGRARQARAIVGQYVSRGQTYKRLDRGELGRRTGERPNKGAEPNILHCVHTSSPLCTHIRQYQTALHPHQTPTILAMDGRLALTNDAGEGVSHVHQLVLGEADGGGAVVEAQPCDVRGSLGILWHLSNTCRAVDEGDCQVTQQGLEGIVRPRSRG